MKRWILLLMLAASLLFTACEAVNERRIAGVWSGDGSFAVEEIVPPLPSIDTLMFNTDYTGYALGNGTHCSFTWAVTDDTLTLRFPEISVGLRFEVNRRTLSVHHLNGVSEFTKLAADNHPFGGNHDQN